MEKKLIDLHFEWMGTGVLPHFNGLCDEFKFSAHNYSETFELFEPTIREENTDLYIGSYWASDEFIMGDENNRYSGYGKIRQSIVLLICAMHGEI